MKFHESQKCRTPGAPPRIATEAFPARANAAGSYVLET